MKKAMATILALGISFAFAGCYDNRETDKLATVMAVGIDQSAKNGCKVYTFAVADTSGMSGVDNGDGTSLICFLSEGRNVDEATQAINSRLSKALSFSHLSAILFSESVAKEGMYDDINHFENKIFVRPQTMIAITDTDAGVYLDKLSPVLESNPEKYFQSIFKDKKITISDFINAFYTKKEIFVPIISTSFAQEYSETNSFTDSTEAVYDGKLKEK